MDYAGKRVSTGTKLWIANGVFWCLFAIYVWGSWILGPDFKENTIGREAATDRKSTRLNSSHLRLSRMPSSA